MTIISTTTVEKRVEPFIDTGNLLILDRDPIGFDYKKDFAPTDEELLRITRDNTQSLFNEIWKLPRAIYEDAICAELPAEKYALPREKPIPQKAPPTRWEKFSKSKGIRSHRDKKVWDEQSESWKPRYGYNRPAKDDWLVELP